MTLLDTELKTYEENRESLLASAEGKFVLICKDQIEGTYESQGDAISAGYKKFGNVPFLVKQITRIDIPVTYFATIRT